MIRKIFNIFFKIVLSLVACFLVWYFLQFPRLDRDWGVDQQILPEISFDQTFVSVRHVRDFDYRTTEDFVPAYYDAVYDTAKLTRAWYIIEPFGERDGPAHTMLTFDFADGQHVAVSAEIRKEKGESFDAVK